MFSQVINLRGDQGAKKLIYQEDFSYNIVEFERGNIDIDTTEDVELLKQLEKQ
ncbi:glycosyltransferase family protein [Mangrovivirga cuniculi]|uniref:hypothetical protein n=1 Tax=Mangrovivirga cuniculi TaxID=2715131 RepID=UPI001586DE9F|nr:hypothetical protein [Mangrovivirga cuniculi]